MTPWEREEEQRRIGFALQRVKREIAERKAEEARLNAEAEGLKGESMTLFDVVGAAMLLYVISGATGALVRLTYQWIQRRFDD